MTAIRRTKIVATLGPSSNTPEALDAMFLAGLNVVRLNFSHGDPKAHVALADLVRERAAACRKPVAILADLQGPKIRIARFKHDKVELAEGATFVLDATLSRDEGNEQQVGLDYKSLPNDVVPGDVLLLDDGRIVLQVTLVEGERVVTMVKVGGTLSNNKGINKQGGGLSADALTEKDKQDILTAVELEADYLAVSFPRSAEDLNLARKLLQEAGGHAAIVAKVERAEAIECIEEIIDASDVIMVARGDLGVEIGDAALPPTQKKIIKLARRKNKATIIATQMMETMIVNPIPTRAEVFDVANAVLDGTDAVMLSGETAVGKYPVQTIAAMHRICFEAEQQREVRVSGHRIDTKFERMDEAIAMGAMYMANHLDVKAIVALTETGMTALMMSRISSGIPICALTPEEKVARKVTLYRGVYPIKFERKHRDHLSLNRDAIAELGARGIVKEGDVVVITKGDIEMETRTNALKLVRVGEL
jgi:pyruvate kinase